MFLLSGFVVAIELDYVRQSTCICISSLALYTGTLASFLIASCGSHTDQVGNRADIVAFFTIEGERRSGGRGGKEERELESKLAKFFKHNLCDLT